mmetsp:Transcript_134023/g.244468  ORF Transcript_134023/g.244468 Transcript_134023/m.244468 type:complete len:620 (+) Transcript_134023:56-1915(+)
MTRYSEESTTCSSMDVNSLISVGPQSLSRCEKLVVNAMGTNVQVDMQYAHSLSDLQSALQTILQMEGQSFAFYDVSGMTLSTDGDVHDAVAKGLTPLNATLTDAAIHHIENRREELAQMQWKLMRDQLTVIHSKMGAISRQVSDTQTQMEKHKQESESLIDHVQKQALRSFDSEREVTSCEWRQVSERVNAIAQLVNNERQKRDVALQGIDKQLEGVHDALQRERDGRRQDFSMVQNMIQEVKAEVDAEKSVREDMRDKQAFDLHNVTDKIETFMRRINEMFQDQQMEAQRTLDSIHNKFQTSTKQVIQLRADMDTSAQDLTRCLSQMEDRHAVMDGRIVDLSSKQIGNVDRLSERQERMSALVESLRLEGKQSQSQIQTALERLKALEVGIQETEGLARDLVKQERDGRDEQLRRAQLSLQAQQKRQLSELDTKISEKMERESCARERNLQEIYDEVTKGSPVKAPYSPRSMSSSIDVKTVQGSSQARGLTKGALETFNSFTPSESEPGSLKSPISTARGERPMITSAMTPLGSAVINMGSAVTTATPVGSAVITPTSPNIQERRIGVPATTNIPASRSSNIPASRSPTRMLSGPSRNAGSTGAMAVPVVQAKPSSWW